MAFHEFPSMKGYLPYKDSFHKRSFHATKSWHNHQRKIVNILEAPSTYEITIHIYLEIKYKSGRMYTLIATTLRMLEPTIEK
jgi:hypothetical protein